jgi:hypothetical protein
MNRGHHRRPQNGFFYLIKHVAVIQVTGAALNVSSCVAGKGTPGQLGENRNHTAPHIDTDKAILKLGDAIVYA